VKLGDHINPWLLEWKSGEIEQSNSRDGVQMELCARTKRTINSDKKFYVNFVSDNVCDRPERHAKVSFAQMPA